jgi:hypothetical protein
MQRESILYMTDAISTASFLADFYAFSASASLEYAICSGSNIPVYSMYCIPAMQM